METDLQSGSVLDPNFSAWPRAVMEPGWYLWCKPVRRNWFRGPGGQKYPSGSRADP